MSQLCLAYKPSYTGHEAWQAQLEVLRAAVLHLTPKEVLDQIDVAKSTLSEALHERNDKRVAAEWVHVVMGMLAQRHDEVSRDLLRRLSDAALASTPFALRDSEEITPEEMAIFNRVEAVMKKKGRK